MSAEEPIRQPLYARLRRPPSPHSVPGSLPVLCFGDIFSAHIATLGINPSQQEYLSPSGHELTGNAQRFQTLTSLQAPRRAALTDAHCERAISTMRDYFGPDKPVFRWFRPLDCVMQAMDYSYTARKAVHLDLIQEATSPTWSALEKQSPLEASALLVADLPFLRWQLATFPLRAVVCNGKTPLRYACGLLDDPVDVDAIAQGRVEGEKGGVTWYATRGRIVNHALAIMGWNIPLTRPSGLTNSDKEELGRTLMRWLDDIGAG